MTVISGPVTERVEHNTPAFCIVYPLVSVGRVIHIMEDRQVLALIFFCKCWPLSDQFADNELYIIIQFADFTLMMQNE